MIKPEKIKPRSFFGTKKYMYYLRQRAYRIIYVLIILQSVLVIFWMINASVSWHIQIHRKRDSTPFQPLQWHE